MEQHQADLKRRGTTLKNDGASRMSQPPRGKGQLDDFGSSDYHHQRAPGKSLLGRGFKSPVPPSHSEDSFARDDSSDEIDLLGPHSRPNTREPRASGSKMYNDKSSPVDGVEFFIDGEYHKPHPDFTKDGKKVLKGMKFTKNKKKEPPLPTTLTANLEPSHSSTESTKAYKGRDAPPKAASSHHDALRKPFRAPTRINNTTSEEKPSIISLLDEDYEKTPRPPKAHSKPPPRKVDRPLSLFEDDASITLRGATEVDEILEKSKTKASTWPMDDVSPLKGTSGTAAFKVECPLDKISPLKETSNSGGSIRPFPLGRRSPSKDENDARDWRDRNKKKPVPVLCPESPEKPALMARSFPDMSPLSSPQKPPSSSTQGSQRSSRSSQHGKGDKGKAKVTRRRVIESSEESQSETDSVHSRSRVRPFPLATQMFESIHSPSYKRGSSDAEERSPQAERREKKRARGADEILRELMHSDGADEDDEDDLLFNDPNLDPARLCPWCDELLPSTPSPHLDHLFSIARARSSLDPRPTNPLGLYAAPTVFINVCQRHRFESHQIPLAEQRGWPTHIVWKKLAARVRRLKGYLQDVVADVDEDFLPGRARQHGESEDNGVDAEDDENILETRPRKGSTFWKEVVKSVKQKGARKAAGVRGQMITFSKTQPGYYGELGSVVISQTIYDLFPPVDFPTNSTLPLTPTEFIQLVLVPEAAVRLIMDDMRQHRREAIQTLRDSAQYGVAMFPDDHAEGSSASEDIVKARAAARRKQLRQEDAEEEEDADMWGAFSEQDFGDVGPGKLSRTSSRVSVESARPQRACAMRAPSIIDSDSDSDISMASSRASTALKSKKTTTKGKKTAKGSIQAQPNVDPRRSQSVEIVAAPDAPPKRPPRPRAKPRAPNPGQTDTEVTSRVSDIELDWSDAPPASQQIRWDADGIAKKRTVDGKEWQTVDPTTPKAKKTGRAPAKLSSSFAQQITKTYRSSSDTLESEGWAFTLRAPTSSGHEP